MRILGVHVGHDSSAALVVDGEVVADVAEERFSRLKHDCGMPAQAVEYCLRAGHVGMDDIDVVAVPSRGPMAALNHLFGLSGSRRERRSSAGRAIESIEAILGRAALKPPVYVKSFPLSKSTELVHVDHHLAHAASAYYTSGSMAEQLIVTMDGAGDGYSTCLWTGAGGHIQPVLKLRTDASLGWFYSNVTEALGWYHGDGEGKTMGLAPYGDASRLRGVLGRFHPRFEDGQLVEGHDFGRPFYWNERGALQWHFEEAYEIKRLAAEHGREAVAAEAQRVLEEQTLHLVLPWLDRLGLDRLSCAGGIFLNVKLNQRIWESGKVSAQHIFPNAGDSGLAVGAALHTYHTLRPGAENKRIRHLYLGPEFSEGEIEAILKARSLTYRHVEDIERFVAARLAEDSIVGWFQGRMESGPRALGNRSILMSANRAENKDIINARVKFREAFRPFCPSLCGERKEEYLERPREEAFMITSFNCREEKRGKVPAVVHADMTMRPQTVEAAVNPRYWRLIDEFGRLTGEPLLLNTSFNVMGEPIVSHPRDAIRCFFDCGLDYCVLGRFVLSKG